LAPAPAAAAPEPAVQYSLHPPAAEPQSNRWYGWQTLATDGASFALVVGSISLGGGGDGGNSISSVLLLGAFGAYALGGPVVHLVHGNPGRAFASLGMRVGGPILLAFAGVAAENCGNQGGDFCGLGGALLGVTAGVITAVAVDAAVFAYDERPESRAAAPRFRLGLSPRGVVAFGTF
jgi:hypothetical protein